MFLRSQIKMEDINFCPFCDSPRHKLLLLDGNLIFCRHCRKFFRLSEVYFKCWKCDSKKFQCSEYSSPDGQVVFQCLLCKKLFTKNDFFKNNEMLK